MGELNIFNLQDFLKQNNCEIYVETGTGIGVCLSHMLQYGLKKYHSVDLDTDLIKKAELKFKDHNVEFFNDYSHKALEKIVPSLPKEVPVLFFLDAHFPDADFGKTTYEDSIRSHKEDALPLVKEIKAIKKYRDISKDSFIIDDWKLYDPNLSYEYGGWEHKDLQDSLGLETNSSDVLKHFKDTHSHTVNLRHQGFLILTPLDKKR